MAASDLLITEPGPATISEALYMNLPMVLDATGPVLRWEEMNLELVRKYGLGEVVRAPDELRALVEQLLGNRRQAERTRANLASFPKRRFNAGFRALVEEMLAIGAAAHSVSA